MLVLVRHGRTDANAAHLLQGRLDLPLDAQGRRQAELLAAAGVAREADLVVCSPLRRARETAALLSAEVVIDERWVEVDYGELDGRPVADAWAPLWQRWRADPGYAPPGGESLAAVGRRVRAACEELRQRATSGDVVVVTHVSPIKAAVTWALSVPDAVASQLFLDVASVSRITMGDQGPMVHSLNETWHLA
ncbi:MAG: histidine phosphatase family protein [Acidimicrobiales bacterium]|nr:MAG: histidine phosphatase family protein [Acidimicrobiales bacterium]